MEGANPQRVDSRTVGGPLKQKILAYATAVGRYIVRKVLIWDLIIFIGVGLSFFIWGEFSISALSERLVWTGIGLFLIAGMLVFSQTSGGRDFGVPGQFVTTAHASVLHDWNIEIRKDIERRFDFRFTIMFVGAIVFLAGVLVDVLF